MRSMVAMVVVMVLVVGTAQASLLEDLLRVLGDKPWDKKACKDNLCENGAICYYSSEKPHENLEGVNVDYECRCKKGFGGALCHIVDPCSKCPKGTAKCIESPYTPTGSFCYNKNWEILGTRSFTLVRNLHRALRDEEDPLDILMEIRSLDDESYQ